MKSVGTKTWTLRCFDHLGHYAVTMQPQLLRC